MQNFTVSHSENFVDSETDIYTNTIKEIQNRIKLNILP